MPPRASRAATQRPRQTATRAFLFSDLRGYTDFVEKRGDAAAADLLREYRDIVRREVGRARGVEVKTEGDSFYVVFESPLAAVDCAVAIQRRTKDHNAASDHQISVGIGLHAGETVPFDKQYVGGAVNVAARIASKAKAGEILVSDTLRGLVRTGSSFEMEDRGPLKLKGVGERVRAWSVVWDDVARATTVEVPSFVLPISPEPPAIAAPAPGQLVCPVLVGREDEVARFRELVTLAAQGKGQTALLSGEAGVGKSAFVRTAIATATGAGFRVLYGVTLEADRGLPYAPFVAALRSGFRGIDRDRLGKVLARTAPDLAQLFPELGRAWSDTGSAVEHRRLSVAFQGLFATFAREAPVLVIVEDLHWCDEASLGLFHYLARELRDQRILLLGTYRSDEMHRRHPLLRTLANMQRERVVTEISLGRLEREKVRKLIHETFFQTDKSIQVGDEFLDAIYERSEGNPFFTEELLKSLVESGDVYFETATGWSRKPIDQLRIPGSVREAVRERVERLSPEAQQTLAAAATIGLRSPFEVLRKIREIGEMELEAHLKEAIDQQLVVELGDADAYGFRHALTKEVVYDDLMVRERKRLHRKVADALARDGNSEPALLAHHLIAAGDGAAAVPHLIAAGDRALRAYAPREAVAHWERAIELGLPDEQVAPVLEKVAEAYYLFDFALARKAAEEAAALYRSDGDKRGISRMLRLASRSVWQQGDANRAAAVAQEAIDAIAGLEETPELGRALANLGTLRMLARADDEAIGVSDRAIEIGRRFDDAWTIANGLITKGTVERRFDWDAGTKSLREGIDLAKAKGLAEVALRGYNNLLVLSAGHVSPEENDRLLEEGQEYAHRHGLEHPMMHFNRAFRGWMRGDWDDAIAAAELVPEGSFWRRQVVAMLAQVALGREGPAAAIAMYTDRVKAAAEIREAQSFTWPVIVMASFHAHSGDREGCASWMRRLRERAAEDPGTLPVVVGGPVLMLGVLAAYVDDRDWLQKIEELSVEDPVARQTIDQALRASRALFEADAAVAARGVADVQKRMTEQGAGALPSIPILAVSTLLDRGAVLGREWRGPFAAARAFAERARATWFRARLEELEAKIQD